MGAGDGRQRLALAIGVVCVVCELVWNIVAVAGEIVERLEHAAGQRCIWFRV